MPRSPPAWRVQRYLAQKQGTAYRECEDALACNPRTWACAVADGATEAFGARWWARLLVRGWVRCPAAADKAAFLELVSRLAQRAQRRWSARSLPWYAEEKRLQGSYAAFAGLLFQQTAAGLRWRALALGDSCLLQLRAGALVAAMPLSQPEQFALRPVLVPTRPDAVARCAAAIGEYAGSAEPGDSFLLLSDAAACWLLGALRSADPAAAEFLKCLRQGRADVLAALIAEQRHAGRMRNDDVAALAISFDPSPCTVALADA